MNLSIILTLFEKKLNDYNNKTIKNYIFYSFLTLFSLLIIKAFLIDKYYSGYIFQEWLINYSQGFVRRGLTGQIFLVLKQIYDLDLYKLFMVLNYSIFLLFASFYLLKVKECKKFLNGEILIVFLFLPSLILFPVNNLSMIGRKEFFFFFGLLINLFFVKDTVKKLTLENDDDNNKQLINKYCLNIFIYYNLLSIPSALAHEAILFLGLPINMLITANVIGSNFSHKNSLFRTSLIYLPTIFVSCLGLIYKGNADIALGICQSWEKYNIFSNCQDELPSVLTYFDISMSDTIFLV